MCFQLDLDITRPLYHAKTDFYITKFQIEYSCSINWSNSRRLINRLLPAHKTNLWRHMGREHDFLVGDFGFIMIVFLFLAVLRKHLFAALAGSGRLFSFCWAVNSVNWNFPIKIINFPKLP